MAGDGFEEPSTSDLTYASHSAAPHFAEFKNVVVRRKGERWPDDERDRITAESFAPGATISGTARRNGVSLGLLHYWRRHARNTGLVEELRFVPVAVADRAPAVAVGVIEIVVNDARIRIEGDVDVMRLRSVLTAVRA
jgi:transposase